MKNRRSTAPLFPAALLLLLSAASFAQSTSGVTGGTTANPTAASSASLIADAVSDGSRLQPAWLIKPRISLTETLTDNVNIGLGANGSQKQSDQITQIAPGIRIEAKTARLKGYFDYTANQSYYLQHSDYGRTQNALNTFSTLEAIDNWLFVDVSGMIAQQSISAFGPQSTSTTSINSNSTETSTYRVSPYIRGQIGGAAEYQLRYNASTTRADTALASNVDLSQWTGQLRGSTPFQKLKWTVDGNQQSTEYSSGRKTDADLLRAIGTYSVLPDFRVSLSGGREANNYASAEQESHNTHGFGFDWTPTERTKLSMFKEKRFFGDGHNFSFSHRFPLSSISYTDTKDVSVLPNQFSTVNAETLYSDFYNRFYEDPNFRPDIKGPQRDAFVRNMLAGLNQYNIGFLSSRATLQRRQQLALALTGTRNTLTLLANRSESQSLLAAADINIHDDLSNNSLIQQRGLSLNLSHRLSEVSTLNALVSRQESIGSGGTTDLKTTTTLYQLGFSTKLGAKTTGVVNARRSVSVSNTSPYSENAVIGSVNFVY
ncbi:TIGR03016 family PEP-CTERM system-associated outer membrane protein [Rhodocyclus tenuis]|uniref:TIGR03016 family PEP-CTERM system-associated outer membrane protein n=1 Tax=Rhodocyclus tenuis TaxID=1066 RepID=UPI001907AA1D|nr:TIGR03016 family PEP-CTERM system-associated outer membrane protein [Rhodocyclus tenuis]